MKEIIVLLAVGLLTHRITQAQGTIYLSNLGQSFSDSNPIASDSWLAADFITGNNTGGYFLNSIQLGLADASGNPSGFTLMIYNNGAPLIGAAHGSSLGALDGSANPSTAGIYTFTSSLSLMLSPGTIYFIVLTAGTTVANGAYEWDYASASSYNPTGNWGGGIAWGSSNGSLGSWRLLPYDYPQYAITATAIPEPGVLSFFALGGLILLWHRRRL